MSGRMKVMLSAVALLVVVNLWRWWPQVEPAAEQSGTVTPSGQPAMSLNLAGYEPASGNLVEMKRDLFSPVSTAAPQPEPEPIEEKTEKAVSDNTQQKAAEAEMAKYKLVGILSRNGVKQGFLVRDDKNFKVRKGDRLEKRFLVEEVSLTSVTLGDPNSRISKKIELD